MLSNRQFKVVFVTDSHGAGIGATAKADREVMYAGKAMTVKP
jgi:hypothetical protein